MFTCPHCKQIYLANPHVGDFVHNCTIGGDTITKDSIPLIGPWTDFTGSGGVNSRNQQMFAGTENELQGTIAETEGEKLKDMNIFGKTKSTHRLRQHQEYIQHGR
jgi:hypothetical protein